MVNPRCLLWIICFMLIFAGCGGASNENIETPMEEPELLIENPSGTKYIVNITVARNVSTLRITYQNGTSETVPFPDNPRDVSQLNTNDANGFMLPNATSWSRQSGIQPAETMTGQFPGGEQNLKSVVVTVRTEQKTDPDPAYFDFVILNQCDSGELKQIKIRLKSADSKYRSSLTCG